LLATVLVIAIGISLGRWQSRRAVEKETLEQTLLAREAAPQIALTGQAYTADELEYRRVSVRGEFVRGWTVYLDNRPHNAEAGFYVLTLLKIADSSSHVLVARGWVKRNMQDRTKLPPIPVPEGTVEIQGVVRSHPGKLLQLGTPEPVHPGAIVQNLDVPTFAQQAHLPMQPFLIEQSSNTHDGLVRDWPRPSSGAEKHRGYAFQWYALAATAFIFFLVTGFRRGRT
jgi:cytochrome oxidase assembly protein ShyY1